MQVKTIKYFGKSMIIACDRKCNKAWGINNRPQIQLSDDPDDYAFLSDGDLLEAPADPGIYEGGHGKPIDGCFNKWCARECERSVIVEIGEPVVLPDFSVLNYNRRDREVEARENQ